MKPTLYWDILESIRRHNIEITASVTSWVSHLPILEDRTRNDGIEGKNSRFRRRQRRQLETEAVAKDHFTESGYDSEGSISELKPGDMKVEDIILDTTPRASAEQEKQLTTDN